MSWYYTTNGNEAGPASEADVRSHLASGGITPKDRVKPPNHTDWIPSSQASKYFGGAPATAEVSSPLFALISSKRALILNGGWCFYLLLKFFTYSDLTPVAAGLLWVVLITSVVLLVIQCRGYMKQLNAEQLLAQAEERVQRKLEKFKLSLKKKAGHAPVFALALGGSGAEVQKGELTLISCRRDCIAFSDPTAEVEKTIGFDELINLDISGPGTVTTNAGLVAFGSGMDAIAAAWAAAAVNKFTTKSTTNTFLRISTARTETHFHIGYLEPEDLRMIFSAAIVHIEAARHRPKASGPDAVSDEITKLHRLLQTGVLTAEEFSGAKARLLKVQ